MNTHYYLMLYYACWETKKKLTVIMVYDMDLGITFFLGASRDLSVNFIKIGVPSTGIAISS